MASIRPSRPAWGVDTTLPSYWMARAFPSPVTQPSEIRGDNDSMSRIRTGPPSPGGTPRTGQKRIETSERSTPGLTPRTDDRSAFEGSRPRRGPALLPPPHTAGSAGPGGLPSPGDLRAIASIPDAGARNRAMVQGWTLLSDGLARHLGRLDASWPTFAGWAGAGLGSVTRAEAPVGPELEAHRLDLVGNALVEVDAALAVLGRPPVDAGALDASLRGTWAGVQQLLDASHRDLFSGVAPALVAFIAALDRGPAAATRYVEGLPADAPMLGEALSSYAHAAVAEGALRSELILLGNDQLGLQQQTLLQGADARMGSLEARGAFHRELQRLLGEGPATMLGEVLIERAAGQFALELGDRALGMLATLARPHERVGEGPARDDVLRARRAELQAALGLPPGLGPLETPAPEDLARLMERQRDPHWFGHPLDRS